MRSFRRPPLNYFIEDVTKKYFAFQGRAGRSEFWFYMLFYVIILVVLNVLAVMLGGTNEDGVRTPNFVIQAIALLVQLGLLLPTLGVGVRRLHDTNRSGWWILISLVPFVGGIILLVFYIMDSTPGPNQFGPNPRDERTGVMASA